MTNKKSLQARWNAPITGADLSESHYGVTEEGLLDFRGAGLTSMFKFEVTKVDFSYSYLRTLKANVGHVSSCSISKSKFYDVKYDGTFSPYVMSECVFEKGLLSVDIASGKWVGCIFDGVNFKKSSAGKRVVFDKCVFSSCNMTRVQFMECTFKECVFKNCNTSEWTSFAASKFSHCDLSEMDFDSAIMDEVQIE